MTIDAMAMRLVQKLLDDNVIPFEKWEIYLYGLQLMLSGVVKFSGFMVLAFFFNCVVQAIFFLTGFALLRIFAGGHHAGSYLECFISTCLLMFSSILVAKSQLLGSIAYTVAILAAALIIILKYAPVDCPNRRLTEAEKKLNRKRSIMVVTLVSFGIFTAYLLKQDLLGLCNVVALALLLESITLIPIFAFRQIK
jgi:accessory gene regulator B